MPQPGKYNSRNEDWIPRELADIRRELQQLRAANPFGLTRITPKDGGIDVNGFINSLRPDGTTGVSMDEDGVFVVYDEAGATPVARFGPLDNSAPGKYGVEVLVGSTWVQLGAQATTWSGVAGKPSTYNATNQKWTPDAHTHPGADVTSRVASATDATGSASGYANPVQGTSFVAAWLGNDGTNSFGRNTSSIKYKTNVRAHDTDPANVLQLQPVLYDRISGGANEYGLIAEQVHEHVPELVSWFDSEIDSVRYDLLSVALIDVVRDQENRIRALEGREPLPARHVSPNVPAAGAPAIEPDPLPYTIKEQDN